MTKLFYVMLTHTTAMSLCPDITRGPRWPMLSVYGLYVMPGIRKVLDSIFNPAALKTEGY